MVNGNLEQTLKKFAPCLLKWELEAINGNFHDYFKGRWFQGFTTLDAKQILPKGTVDSWFHESKGIDRNKPSKNVESL